MTFETCNIEGLMLFIPKVFEDDRGAFFESFNQAAFEDAIGEKVLFVQDNQSISKKNVLRGLHFQHPPYSQGKLVRISQGAALDVAVDIRKDSKTYGQTFQVLLTAENAKQLWIPPGFAHGFLALEENTIFNYKCTNYYHPASEDALLWNDSTLDIKWTIDEPIVSEKDKVAKLFSTFVSPF